MKALMIYGDPYTGKSTLDLNLRRYYCGTHLCQDSFQFNGTHCFLGKTAKRHNQLMSCGGAESLKSRPELPDAEWLIAALPTRGMQGTKITTDLLREPSFFKMKYAICLYTDKQSTYRNRRVMTFSGRESLNKRSGSKLRKPTYVDTSKCFPFKTEELYEAMVFAVNLMGAIEGKEIPAIKTLEDLIEDTQCSTNL